MTTAMTERKPYEATELLTIIRKGAEIALANGAMVDPKALIDLLDRNGVYA